MANNTIEWSWQGVFEYSFNDPTCKWRYADISEWKINKDSGAKLSKLASRIIKKWKDLREALAQIKIDLPAVKDQGFLRFFSNNESSLSNSPTVMHGISVMLTNIVSSQCVKEFTILSNFVDQHVTVQMKGLPFGHPCWFYLQLEDKLELIEEEVLCCPENVFIMEMENKKISNTKGPEDLEETIRLFQYRRVFHKYIVLKYTHEETGIKISLKDQVRSVPYEKGRICKCLPIPGKPKKIEGLEDYSVLTPEVVIESPNVIKVLESLSRIWEDRFARSILISAPPGSGKENFANSIPFGNGRPTDNFLSISMATGDIESTAKQLLGVRRDDGLIEQGLIAKAKGSALFLDEVHHPEKNQMIRASLLRPLETDEYYPVGSNNPEKVQDVQFILATSKPLMGPIQGKSLADIPPRDFWTRMTHVLQIKHPMDYKEKDKSPRKEQVLQSLYRFFWWERVEQFYGFDPLVQRSTTQEQPYKQLIYLQARKLLNEKMLVITSKDFSQILLEMLGEVQLQELSIRGIRSMVSRMFSIAVSDIRRGYDLWKQTNFKNELKIVIKEILEVAKLEKHVASS